MCRTPAVRIWYQCGTMQDMKFCNFTKNNYYCLFLAKMNKKFRKIRQN